MSAFLKHVRKCLACKSSKQCSEAERLIGEMDSEKVLKAVGARKWIHGKGEQGCR